MIPSIGRNVLYKLSANDAETINKRRLDFGIARKDGVWVDDGAQAHAGNEAHAGQVFPMVIVNVFDTDPVLVNGQVILDGNDVLWATSVAAGIEDGTWFWPARA